MKQQTVDELKKSGFSVYEAGDCFVSSKSYPVTGYPLSILAGVTRSRIYETFDRLTASSYALALQTDPIELITIGVKDLPVQMQERSVGALPKPDWVLSQIATIQERGSVWNLQCRNAILHRARAVIRGRTGIRPCCGFG